MPGSLATNIVIDSKLGQSFRSTIESSTRGFGKLGSAIQKAERQQSHIEQFKRLKVELGQTETAHQQARDRVGQLGREMSRSSQPTRQMRAALGQAHQQVHRLNQKLGTQRSALGQTRLAMKQAGVATTQLERQERKLGATVDQLRGRYDRLTQSIKKRQVLKERRSELGGKLIGTAVAGAALALPIKAAIDFESKMADVKKVVNFDTPQQFKAMSSDILKLSTVIPMSAEGLGDIVAAAGQAGIAREELLEFASDAAKMGVAFDMAGAEAGSAMTGLRTLFKLNQDQVVRLGDAYNHLSNNMDATARDMLNIANRAGASAELFGLSGEQVGALGATFLALKTQPEVAATGINSMLLKLQAADKQGPKFQQALAGIGMSAQGLKDAIEQDAQGALLGFLEAVESSDDVSGTLFDLFGLEYTDDMAKLVGGLDLYRKSLGLVADETKFADSMQKEYEERSKTTANELELMKNRMYRLGVTVGSVTLPALGKMTKWAGKAVDWMADLAEEYPTLTTGVVGLTTATLGLTVALLAGGYAVLGIKTAWQNAKISWEKGGKVIGWTRTKLVAFNKTALVTAARTKALAAGGAIKTGWAKAGEAIGWTRTKLVAFNKTALVTAARTKALAAGGAIQSFGASLVKFATTGVTAAMAGFKGLIASTWAWTAALLANPITWVVVAAVGAVALIYKYWEPISGFFVKLWDAVKVNSGAAWEWIKGVWGSVTGWFGRLWTGVESFFSNLSLFDAGKAILTTLGEGILGAGGWLLDQVTSVFGKVRGLLPFSDAKEGPLAALTASGKSIMGTLGEGVRQAGPQALQRPLARALGTATAGLALTLPVAAQATPAATVSRSPLYQAGPANTGGARSIDGGIHIQQLTINQLPGEDARKLATRVLDEIERQRLHRLRKREYDAL